MYMQQTHFLIRDIRINITTGDTTSLRTKNKQTRFVLLTKTKRLRMSKYDVRCIPYLAIDLDRPYFLGHDLSLSQD